MELVGSVTIPATPQQVWAALSDPEILRKCIPGCEEVKQISAEEMHARVLLRMGPVRARFTGKVRMTDIRPDQGYTLNFEGSGGSAGFARGSSVISLTAVEQSTRLDYTAQASVAGKLGQIGGRLIDASSRQLADRFFANLKLIFSDLEVIPADHPTLALGSGTGAPPAAETVAVAEVGGSAPAGWFAQELPRLVWFLAGVAATSIGVWIGSHWVS